MHNNRLKKSERLKGRTLFGNLFKEGRYYKSEVFSLRFLYNNLTITRLGISVKKDTFPKAIQRNRIKRLVREVFRRNKHRFCKSCDILVRPKKPALAKIDYTEIEKELLSLFKGAGILK